MISRRKDEASSDSSYVWSYSPPHSLHVLTQLAHDSLRYWPFGLKRISKRDSPRKRFESNFAGLSSGGRNNWPLHPVARKAPMAQQDILDAGDTGEAGSIPGSGRSPSGGNGKPLQYSCLENPMDRGDWWATVHGVTKSRTGLSTQSTSPVAPGESSEPLWYGLAGMGCGGGDTSAWWLSTWSLHLNHLEFLWKHSLSISTSKVSDAVGLD